MAVFRRKRPKSFEGSALASCRRLRPEVQWKHDRGNDQIAGDGITIDLANLRNRWDERDENQRASWLEGHLSEVLYQVGDEGDGSPHDDDLRAMIRPRVMVESSRLQALIDKRGEGGIPPYKSLSDDLVGIVGVDSPSAIALVSGHSLEDWATTFDSLWERGVTAIGKLPEPGGWAHVNDMVYVSGTHDDYTNSRLLDPEYLDRLQLNGPAVVLLPHRNSLIAAPLIDDEAVTLACDLALQELNEPSPICVKPFVWSNGELQPLTVGAEHPAYSRVSLLRLIDDDINHKQVVPQMHELTGGELIIGGFYVDQERLVSSTNWGPGAALIPKTDEIVFVDDDTNPLRGMATDWDAAADLFGPQMIKTDYYPVRYRVEGLPDIDAIRSIGRSLTSLTSF